MEPDVTFLTPVFEAEETLDATLAAILAQETPRPFEVVVVDDGSRDGSRALAERWAAREPRVRVVSRPNGGEAAALNTGWRLARGRFVAIVEADVEPAPDWLARCLAALEAEPGVWAVGGYLETPREDPWIARLAGYEVERRFASKPRECAHLTSANVLYRAEAFAAAGPFDEQLVNASLDSVFNARLRAAGGRLLYEPRARVRHHYKTSLAGYLRRQYAYARYRRHNPSLELYPADRWLALEVGLTALGAAGVAAAPLAALTPLPGAGLACAAGGAGLLGAVFALQVPRAVEVLLRRRDPAVALATPPVLLARNLVGAAGYAAGLAAELAGRP